MSDNPYQAPQAIEAEILPLPPRPSGDPGALSLEYDNTIDDLAAISKIYIRATPAIARRILFLRWAALLLAVAICWLLFVWYGSVGFLASGAISAVVLFFVWPRYVYWRRPRNAKIVYQRGRNRGLLGKHRLTLKGFALEEANEGGYSVRQTDTIERVIRSREHIAIFVSAASAFLIPLASVRQGNVEQFLAALRAACPPDVPFVDVAG